MVNVPAEGRVTDAEDVQVQVPAGILIVVVEDVTEFNAACTSDSLQLAALMVCASDLGRTLKRSAKNTYFKILFILDSPKEIKSPTGDSISVQIPLFAVSDEAKQIVLIPLVVFRSSFYHS